MCVKQNKVIRQSFFSHLVEIITKIRKQTSLNTEQNPSPPSDDSEKIPIGLPGSIWLFGCSAGAAQEIAAYDDQLNTLPDDSIKQESLDDYWVRPESDGLNTDQ